MSLLDDHIDKWTPEPNTGCFVWLAGGNPYGKVRINGKMRNVPRLVCEETNGSPPTLKHEAAHNTPNGCIGKRCVNGAHLRWATRAQNRRDISIEDRSVIARKGRASLTSEQRKAITDKMLVARLARPPEWHSENTRKGWETRRGQP